MNRHRLTYRASVALLMMMFLLLVLPVWASPNQLVVAPVEIDSGSPAGLEGRKPADHMSLCYSISKPAKVTIKIFDEQGDVSTLLDNVPRKRGYNCEAWDSETDNGFMLSPGTYQYLIAAQVSDLTETAAGKAVFTQMPFAVGSFWAEALDQVMPALRSYHNTGLISSSELDDYIANWQSAARLLEELAQKERIREYRDLSSVLRSILRLNDEGELSPDRVKILLGKVVPVNTDFFAKNPAPEYSYTTIPVPGSSVTYVYYAGQGIQFQPVTTLLRLLEGSDEDFLEAIGELEGLFADRFHHGKRFKVLEYYFEWEGHEGPWISSMAQGLALETVARAYKLTEDARYLALGAKLLEAFYVPWDSGGFRSTDAHAGWWYLEFSYTDKPRVLNGFLYSLLGLHAYYDLTGDAKAEELLARGLIEVEQHLADYDLPLEDHADAGWSKYSLTHGTASLDYHLTHLVLLSKLNLATGSPVLAEYHQRWHKGLKRGVPD